MKIKVSNDHLTRLWDALDKANGKAKTHVALPGDILALAAKAEANLAESGLPTRERAGASVTWHAPGASALSYRYKMTRTHLTLTRGSKDWFLTDVRRVGVHPTQAEHYRIRISPSQRDRIVATTLRTFEVREQVADIGAASMA